MEFDNQTEPKWILFLRRPMARPIFFGVVLFWLVILGVYYMSIAAPSAFPQNKIITLEDGLSLQEAAEKLEEERIVNSDFWLRTFVILLRGERAVIAGDYYFEEPVSVFRVAHRITDKDYRMPQVRITIPEGLSTKEMAEVYSSKLPRFNTEDFLTKAAVLEGYLFPDTYFFSPTAGVDAVIASMKENFDKKIEPLLSDIEASDNTLEEIITMASIIELEGKTVQAREIISGILWKRIEIGMALQVDASFAYILNKGTSEITAEDLKLDSPYNSYKHRGLPPTPISNPGLESIRAAIFPKQSPYLYYLSDRDGNMYYARDFEEHKENKRKYLN